jgi:hypothetical protein
MKDFWIHLGAQVAVAAAGAAITSASGADYSSLGVWAGAAQAVTALAAELFNQFSAKAAPVAKAGA